MRAPSWFASRGPWTAALRAAAALLAASILLVPGLRAQSDPRLGDAVHLAQDGQGDSARAVVARLLAATDPTDSLYPQILYTQGVVANSPDERRRIFRRITVEYGTSAWADDALLGLAMLDYAAGNFTASVGNLERIDSDYPDSPVIPLAAYWAARSYFDLKKPTEACRWITNGMARAGDNIEVQNQLNYYQGRCAALAAQPPESTRTDTANHPAPVTPPAGKPGFSVQVAAVKTQSAADKVVSALKASGFEAHTVSDAGLLKVRVGHFADRAGAQAAAAKVKAKLGGAPYVVDES